MKNCSDWEQEIAGERESAELDKHLRGCERCREFAGEIEKNRAALNEVAIDPAAFTAVRARVLSGIQARRRRAMWWSWSAVAAAACFAILGASVLLRPANTPAPRPLVAVIPPPEHWIPPVPAVHKSSGRHLAKVRPAQKTEPVVAVKMLTDDPNVIIIWLVDQKGDSL